MHAKFPMLDCKVCHGMKQQSVQALKQGGDPANFETFDIYLLPPGEDIETCASWLRMRNREGRYQLMFEEWVVDGPFIITPASPLRYLGQILAQALWGSGSA